jgi:hypothetical protein
VVLKEGFRTRIEGSVKMEQQQHDAVKSRNKKSPDANKEKTGLLL